MILIPVLTVLLLVSHTACLPFSSSHIPHIFLRTDTQIVSQVNPRSVSLSGSFGQDDNQDQEEEGSDARQPARFYSATMKNLPASSSAFASLSIPHSSSSSSSSSPSSLSPADISASGRYLMFWVRSTKPVQYFAKIVSSQRDQSESGTLHITVPNTWIRQALDTRLFRVAAAAKQKADMTKVC